MNLDSIILGPVFEIKTTAPAFGYPRLPPNGINFGSDDGGFDQGVSDPFRLTNQPRSLISYLIEISDTVDDYESFVSRIRRVSEFLDTLKLEGVPPLNGEADLCAVSSGFQQRIRNAIDEGLLPSLSESEEAIVVLSNLAAYEILHKPSIKPLDEAESGEDFVINMVERAKSGLPPEVPYFSRDWATPMEFLLDIYGSLLSTNPSHNFLYQDQIGWIHPSKKKMISILGNSELYGSELWGEDLLQALRNYFSNRGGVKALSEVLPTKKQRNDKHFLNLGLSQEDIADPNKRSAAAFLKL